MWGKPTKGCVIGAIILASGMASATPVGRLSGSFGVSDTGQGAYTIPVKLPAGTNGLTPTLALRYSSSTSRGLLGVGWSLSGLSTITRCPKQKVLDGLYDRALVLDPKDKLCLDGQRLLSDRLDNTTTYRSEIQSFNKISATLDSATHQPANLTVTTKDGLVMKYGTTADSKIEVQGRTDGAVIAWLISEITDRNGNILRFNYTEDAATTSYVPANITYTENPTAMPQITASHRVSFEYLDGTDVSFGFIGNGKLRNAKLLTKIKVESKNTAGTFVEVRRYDFAYRVDPANSAQPLPSRLSKHPLLASVTQCDKGECLTPTTFTWADGQLNFNQSYTGPAWSDASGWGAEAYYGTIKYADINGDGKSDLCARSVNGVVCHLSTGAGFGTQFSGPAWSDTATWNQEKYYSTIQFADLNADGKADICGRGVNGIVCYLSQGNSFDLTKTISGPAWSDAAGWGDTVVKYYYTIQFTDLDQDGRSDICGIGPSGLQCFYTRKNATSGELEFQLATLYSEPSWTNSSADINKFVPVLMPVRNNGIVELCARLKDGSAACKIAKPETDTSQLVVLSPQANFIAANDTRIVDVNGDGLVDVCMGSVTVNNCYKNLSGEGSIAANKTLSDMAANTQTPDGPDRAAIRFNFQLQSSSDRNANAATLRYLDINGDSYADVCERKPAGFSCFLFERLDWATYQARLGQSVSGSAPSDGFIDFFETEIPGPAWTDAANWNQEKYYRTIQMADINGDGLVEVCGRGPNGVACYGSTTAPRDLITSITDGFGAQTLITYKTLTDATVYEKGSTSVYPNVDIAAPMTVVASLQSSNGRGGLNQVDYHYGGLVAHVDRGLQGFAWREVRDQQSNRLQRTTFQQVFPFTSLVTQVDDKYCATPATPSASCTLLHRTQTSWSQQSNTLPSPYSGIYPYASQSTEESWELPTTP